MSAHIFIDFIAPNAKKRSDNGKVRIVDSAVENFAHAGQSGTA